jgi:hypothetical protein
MRYGNDLIAMGIGDYYSALPPYYEYLMAWWMVLVGMAMGVFLPKCLVRFEDDVVAKYKFVGKLCLWGVGSFLLNFPSFVSTKYSTILTSITLLLMPFVTPILAMAILFFLPKYLDRTSDNIPTKRQWLGKMLEFGLFGLIVLVVASVGFMGVDFFSVVFYMFLGPRSLDADQLKSIAALQSVVDSKSSILLWTNSVFLLSFLGLWAINQNKRVRESLFMALAVIMGLLIRTIVRTVELDGDATDRLLLCGLAFVLPLVSIGVTSQLTRSLSPETATPDR